MSKRLQVILPDAESEDISRAARAEGLTVSEWVRQMLRKARDERPIKSREQKLAAIGRAAQLNLGPPEVGVDQMLAEIEQGYLGGSTEN